MRYEAPDDVAAAVALLAAGNGKARVLAGGTDLLVQMRAGLVRPGTIVDIKHIERTRRATRDNGRWRIGAAVAGAELGENDAVKADWPGVVEAFELIGSTQIQGRASLGGNLCNASPAADTTPALIAAGARCVVAGPDGEREVEVAKICTAPGRTSLAPGELVVEIVLPERAPRSADAYLRFIPRTEMDIAVAGAAVSITLAEDGRCSDARVAIGAVAPTALAVPAAAAALTGTAVDDDAIEKMMAAVRAACRPIDDKRGTIAYRTKVAGVLAGRAARIALDRARSR